MNNEEPRDYTLERWIVLLLALLFLLPFIAHAQETNEAALLLKTGANEYTPEVAIKTDVAISVTGPIVRTRVTQSFKNTTGNCTEGIYVFPLPEMSAVDSLRMTIGTRVIVGEIREKEQAKQEYAKARSEGRKAALVEQHRPNIFTTSVASIMPDEDATIEIEYQETARYENGQYSLRFPMVVAPRYESLNTTSAPVPSSISIPNVSLSVDLQPGYSLRDVSSANHRIKQQTLAQSHYRVDLDDTAAGRDFELTWQPDLGSTPEATVITEKVGNETYALLLVTPPAAVPVRMPRETIFIIDSSGSMEGPSMEQAREALLLALDDLRPTDTFNIIDFDSDARALFPQSRNADPDTLWRAKQFVTSLTADGGTEMMKAIQLALPAQNPTPGAVRQVIFMTDGQVSDEEQLFAYIRAALGDSRLFTVGIGAAPNSHFMRNAARFGRGTFTYIGDLSQVKTRMGELFDKLSSPVLTGVEVKAGGAEIWPQRVPDLYRGEPLVVAMRVNEASPVTISGRIGNEPWTQNFTLPPASDDRGIGKLWARQKIESITDSLSAGADPARVRDDVIEVALRHHLVSQYTSLVAVDETPQGLTTGSCQPLVSSDNGDDSNAQGELPQTATPAMLLMIIGAALIVSSLAAAKFVW